MTSIPRTLRRARRWRRPAGLAAALLAFTTLSACGDGADESDSPSAVSTAADGTTFNQADVDFATQMIPHHAQAVQMVQMAQGRDLDPAVAALMEQIRDAQVPEIETMTDWLVTWDEPIPETSVDHVNAGGHGGDSDAHGTDDMDGMDMPGMMSDDEMSALDEASGREFQSMWLSMMEEHHEGAIEMARTEVAEGENPEVVVLAEGIVDGQTAEIERIDQLRE